MTASCSHRQTRVIPFPKSHFRYRYATEATSWNHKGTEEEGEEENYEEEEMEEKEEKENRRDWNVVGAEERKMEEFTCR